VGEEGAVSDFFHAFRFMAHHLSLLLTLTGDHLKLSGAALGISMLIAIPLGAVLGHLHRGSFFAINAANIGRALPSLAVIAIGLAFFGFGFLNNMVALIVLAVPPILTNTYAAVDGVDRDVVEAARGMGMTARQVLTRVELPLALPLTFAGLRTATVYVIATATLASIAGGSGLGDIIANQASYRLEGVLAAAMWVAALALLADGLLGLAQRMLTPTGMRLAGGPPVVEDVSL
jgi:osmoprotectant transport system permease protein